MLSKILKLPLFLVLILSGVLFSGCDRSINPFEDDQGVYSVYGALEVGKPQNIVRIRDLTEPFYNDSSFDFNATVTFTDLETGESTQLRDSVVTFSGNKSHNFILEEDLELDKQYQITVERPDGVSASSIASTPSLTKANYQPESSIFCETKIRFRFYNVDPPEYVQMEIGAEYQGEIHWSLMDLVGDIEYNSGTDAMEVYMSPRNLLVEIFTPVLPDNPYFDPYLLFPTVTCRQLDTDEIFIRYYHYGKEWSNGKPFEFGQIDTESGDVENGLGFFGAYRVDTFTIPLSEEEEEEL